MIQLNLCINWGFCKESSDHWQRFATVRVPLVLTVQDCETHSHQMPVSQSVSEAQTGFRNWSKQSLNIIEELDLELCTAFMVWLERWVIIVNVLVLLFKFLIYSCPLRRTQANSSFLLIIETAPPTPLITFAHIVDPVPFEKKVHLF